MSRSEREAFDEILQEVRRDAEADCEEALFRSAAASGQSSRFGFQVQHTLERLRDLWARSAYVPLDMLSRLYDSDSKAKRAAFDSISGELHLTPDMSVDDLHRIRREFALKHHPDRVDPAQRAWATQRMTIANALIDEALKSRRA
ncbi:MAG TPA: hypothetical protein VG900_07005 [Hyphomicrobiaceae bacterium]|jgi:hypothetical protein|nr:hypothetical protein [Hyphomicrobiaceae bacterium]